MNEANILRNLEIERRKKNKKQTKLEKEAERRGRCRYWIDMHHEQKQLESEVNYLWNMDLH